MKGVSFIKITGEVTIKARDEDGNIVNQWKSNNMVVGGGRNAVLGLISDDGTSTTDKVITEMSWGTNGAATNISDAAPLTDNFDKTLDGHVVDGVNYKCTFTGSLSTSENNGVTIREVGLLCADGTLFARYVWAGVAKTNAISLSVDWVIKF